MKEADARKLTCPFNPFPEMVITSLRCCLGSECMAWASSENAEFKKRSDDEYRRNGMRLISDEGYCKLIGRKGQDT